jgi:hypothetical protein
VSGKQINFGEKIEWSFSHLVTEDKVSSVEYLASIWVTMIYLAVTISFFLAIFQGSLASTWMLINTLQLIAHLPLISVRLPANAHFFILNFLSLIRLNIESINESIDAIGDTMGESRLMSEDGSFYSSQMRSSGYRFGFVRNMVLFLCLALLIALVWLIIAIFKKLRQGQSNGENSPSQTTGFAKAELFMNNFMVRFLYECFFELILCAMINISN